MAGDANIESFVSSDETNSEEECLQKYGELNDQGKNLFLLLILLYYNNSRY